MTTEYGRIETPHRYTVVVREGSTADFASAMLMVVDTTPTDPARDWALLLTVDNARDLRDALEQFVLETE